MRRGNRTKGELRTYHFIFIDIVGLSKPVGRGGVFVRQQVKKIKELNRIMRETGTMKNIDWQSLRILPTGDGMAIGFPDNLKQPFELAREIQRNLKDYKSNISDKQSKIEVRIGLNSGPVYEVEDIREGHTSVWGPGIIYARRIMDIGDAGHILATKNIAELRDFEEEYRKIIKGLGRYSIKHGEELEVYNIYDSQVGNKRLPQVMKVSLPKLGLKQYEKGIFYNPRRGRTYKYLKKVLQLRFASLDNMMVHHKLSCTIKNISRLPQHSDSLGINGDVDKEWGDLNLIIYDENNNILDPLYITCDHPRRKGMFIKLPQPLLPNESLSYFIEWDWEEPLQYYESRFPFGCEEFEFSLEVPKEVKITLNVYKMKKEEEGKTEIQTQEIVEGESKKLFGNIKYLPYDTIIRFEWNLKR